MATRRRAPTSLKAAIERSFLAALCCSEDGALPTEVRIWKAGLNTDLNGYNVLFDEKASKQVMAAYAKHGVALSWDLEHLSLDDTHPNFDPDARASCELELRNGELWATNIRWTPDGARRLREGTQRFPSPAFTQDKDGRPTRVVNIALCARPATDDIEPLAAKEDHMNPITLSQVVATAKLARSLSKAGVAAATIVKTLADGAPGSAGGDVAGVSIPDLAKLCGIDIDPGSDPAGFIKALLSKLSSVVAQLGGAPGEPEGDEPPAPAPGDAMASDEVAAAREIVRLCGATSLTTSIARVAEMRKLAVDHEAQVKRLADEQKALTATRYRQMTARLVVCGAELPATGWADDAKTVPAPHILAQSLDQLEVRALAFEAKNGTKGPLKAPSGGGGELSPRELAMCAEMKIDPNDYAARKATAGTRIQ